MPITSHRLITLVIFTTLVCITGVFMFSYFASAQSIIDGDLVTTADSFDIYIIKLVPSTSSLQGPEGPSGPRTAGQVEKKFKRLILNPDIFNSYGHLRWEDVKTVSQATLSDYTLSELVIEINPDGSIADPKVYRVRSAANSDVGERRWLNITASEFDAAGYDWDSLYHVNHTEASPGFYPTKSPLTYQDILNEQQGISTPATPKGIDETGLGLTVSDGFRISVFTTQSIGKIRFMAMSPDGILFVSLPSAAGLYNSNQNGGAILALPDSNNDGKADAAKSVITQLSNRPHGIAFYNNYLYVAEENRVSRYPYQNNGNVGAREVVVANLPENAFSVADHVSRTIGFSPEGKMYVSIGSSCNVCNESDKRRATIVEYNPDGTGERVYANGIRNAVGFVFHPVTKAIWATENGRDELGDNIPPDEINIIQDGKNYGWPYCYGKNSIDPFGNSSALCAGKEPSIHDMQAHSAPLGLRFIEGPQFPQDWQGDLLVAYHGSWNRTEKTGYKVVRLDVAGNTIVGETDFITGWLKSNESVVGRPVDLIFDAQGALYISDDKANVIYKVTK